MREPDLSHDSVNQHPGRSSHHRAERWRRRFLCQLNCSLPLLSELFHKGEISLEAIRHWKGMLIALNNAFDRESMDLLLYLWHTKSQDIWYSGDGLLRFAGLIAAGLVSFQTEITYARTPFHNVDMHGIKNVLVQPIPHSPQMVVKKIELSDRGEHLVDAWRNGDEAKYRELLSKQHMHS